ncbi:MAG: aldolase/citrate lyase family protein [Alphaproteobacteria bacterium]|nr:aldolase/citrate lyase family protein [Alphaproteobacteria bacterium]
MSDFKHLLQSDTVPIGTYLGEFATPGIGKILKAAGCEFVFIDMEHSGFGFETVKQLLNNLRAEGIATLLRPPSKAGHHLQRAADIGAAGIIAPMVNTAAEARDAVSAVKYPPEGGRGVALNIAHDDYNSADVGAALAAANDGTGLIALIETASGVHHVHEIAALDGVDCLWIGHLDLSASLGIAGQFDNPVFRDAIDRVMTAAREHQVPVGQLVGSASDARNCIKEGCRLICYSGDIWLLQKALRDGISEIRNGSA